MLCNLAKSQKKSKCHAKSMLQMQHKSGAALIWRDTKGTVYFVFEAQPEAAATEIGGINSLTWLEGTLGIPTYISSTHCSTPSRVPTNRCSFLNNTLQLLGVHERIVDELQGRRPIHLCRVLLWLKQDASALHVPIVLRAAGGRDTNVVTPHGNLQGRRPRVTKGTVSKESLWQHLTAMLLT